MGVYVSKVRQVEGNKDWPYPYAALLTADSSQELEEFSNKLELPKEWRAGQAAMLTVTKWVLARELGAVFVNDENTV